PKPNLFFTNKIYIVIEAIPLQHGRYLPSYSLLQASLQLLQFSFLHFASAKRPIAAGFSFRNGFAKILFGHFAHRNTLHWRRQPFLVEQRGAATTLCGHRKVFSPSAFKRSDSGGES